MTQPISTDPDRFGDPWRDDRGYAGTQPLPVDQYGEDPATGRRVVTPPGGTRRVRVRRGRRRFRSTLLELLLAALVSAGVAAVVGRQVLADLGRVIPGQSTDPYLELWSLAWSGHVLEPGSGVPFTQLFDGNAFYPADYSLAFGDSLLGLGPLTWFFSGAAGLVTAYNLIFVFAPALASLGGYALARQLGAHPIGAAVAGAGLAYAPWRLADLGLYLLVTGPMLIALAMLARGHGLTMSGRRTPPRPVWILLGWVVAAWQLTIGFSLGLPFALLLAVIAVLTLVLTPVRALIGRRRRRRLAQQVDPFADPYPDVPEFTPGGAPIPPDRAVVAADAPRRNGRLLLADLLGAGLFVTVGALMAYPYHRVQAIDPQAVLAARGADQILAGSATPVGLITPPAADGTWSWLTDRLTDGQDLIGGAGDVRLLPGAILLAFALLGLVVSTWHWWWRLTLLLALLPVAGLLLGSRFPDRLFPGPDAPFDLLWRLAPDWVSDPAPARLIVIATLPVALLAAGSVSRLCGWGVRGHRGRAPVLRSVLLLAVPVLVVVEGQATVPLTGVPAVPTAFARAEGPTLVLPSAVESDRTVMFWSATRDLPAVANGRSRVTPTTLNVMRTQLAGFPDASSVAYLRQNGFRSVVVLPTALRPDLWPDADRVPDPALGLTRTVLGESVLYRLEPTGSTP